MNQIFKTKKNKLGQSVVTSELAKSKGKLSSVAKLVGLAILGLSSSAFAETTNEITTYGQGATAQTGGTAVGVNAKADTNGTAIGQQATASTQATANGYVSAALANETIAIGVNSGAVGGGVGKETFTHLKEIDQKITEYSKETPPVDPLNAIKPILPKISFESLSVPFSLNSGTVFNLLSDDELNMYNSTEYVNQLSILNDKTYEIYRSFLSELKNFTSLMSNLTEEEQRNLTLESTKEKYNAALALKNNKYNELVLLEKADQTRVTEIASTNSQLVIAVEKLYDSLANGADENFSSEEKALIRNNSTIVEELIGIYYRAPYYSNLKASLENAMVYSLGSLNGIWNPSSNQESLDAFNNAAQAFYNKTKANLQAYDTALAEYNAKVAAYNEAVKNREMTEAERVVKLEEAIKELNDKATELGLGDGYTNLSQVLGSLEGRAIAIGNQAYVSGDESVGVGYGNTVTGSRSNVVGTHNNVTKANNNVMGNDNTVTVSEGNVLVGNNITFATGVTTGNNIALGTDTVISAPVPTASMEIRGTTYEFAGKNPTSVLSIASEGNERQIQNVAAGRVTETSTDAINGSQLYAVASAVSNISNQLPQQIADAIADDVAWSITTSSSEGGNVSGNAVTEVANGDTVTFDAGKNINITQTGQTISIATSDTPTFNHVTINEAPTEGNHATTKDYVDNGRSVVEAGDNVKVEAKTDDATGKTTYTVSADVPNVTVTGGGNVNVTTNVDDATGDITYTIDTPNVTVEGGKNVTVNTTTNDKGDVTYTVDVNVDTLTTNVTAGDNVVVKEAVDADGNKTYTLSANKTTVSSGNGIAVTSTTSISENGATITNYEVALTDDLKSQIAKEESVTAGSKNVTVTQDGTNDTGGKNFVVDIAKDLDLTKDGSVTIGDVVIAGDTINAGGNKITNVANGTNPTDAVNVAQLEASKTYVEAGDKAKVESKTNADSSTTYIVTALTTEVKGGKNAQITESVGDKGQSVYTVDVKGDLTEVNSITNGGSTIKLGDANVSVEGAKITNVANGTAPTDAVNVSQLNAAKTEVKAGENVKVSEEKGANGQSIYTVSATGDLTNVTSISNGDTKVSLGDGIVNVEGNRITNVASPVEAGDAVNKDYVDNSHSTVSSVDGTVKVVKSIVNATTGAINYDLSVKGGVNSKTDDGKVVSYKLGDTITVTGDGKNLSTATTADGNVQVKLADDVKVNSVTTGDVSISTKGVNAGGKKVTNVAPAEISPTSTDAVNGSQLHATNQQVNQNTQNIAKLGDRVNHLDKKIDNVDKRARRGTAIAGAIGMLPQPHISGKSMMSAAVTNYRGEQALAVGYSRLSDNGKHTIKLSGASNVSGKKDVMVGAAYGYQW